MILKLQHNTLYGYKILMNKIKTNKASKKDSMFTQEQLESLSKNDHKELRLFQQFLTGVNKGRQSEMLKTKKWQKYLALTPEEAAKLSIKLSKQRKDKNDRPNK